MFRFSTNDIETLNGPSGGSGNSNNGIGGMNSLNNGNNTNSSVRANIKRSVSQVPTSDRRPIQSAPILTDNNNYIIGNKDVNNLYSNNNNNNNNINSSNMDDKDVSWKCVCVCVNVNVQCLN